MSAPIAERPDPDPEEAEPGDAAAEREHALRLIEALVFASPTPVGEDAVTARLRPGLEAAPLLRELRGRYRFRGINLVRIAGGWTFRTAPDLAGQIALGTVEARRLSRAQLETLTIIAYHQPVTRAEIEEIRGVTLSSGTLDLLMATEWVRPTGRRETPGRPVTWGTTDQFLRHFGLNALADLPNVAELRAAGLLDARPAASLGEGSGEEGGVADEEL